MATANDSGLAVASEDASVVILDVDQIDPSPNNLRGQFSEEDLVRLASSIESHGLLAPIIVRFQGDRFEIVAGERRWRAVKLLGRTEIKAIVRALDDREATEVGLLENLARTDLNPIEKATGFQMLLSLGHDAATIGELSNFSAASIENSVRLLSLPEAWLEHLRAGTISEAAAEYLLPWIEFPDILRLLERSAENWPMPLTNWRGKITETVMRNSRSMDPADPTGPRFEVTEAVRDELRTVEVRVSAMLTIPRAMNVERWENLQQIAHGTEERPQRPATATPERNGTSPKKKPATGRSGRQASPQADEKPTLPAPSEKQIEAWRWNWLANLIGDRLTEFNVTGLERFAGHLGIDLEAELRATAVEMGIDPVTIDDDGQLHETLVTIASI